MNTEEIIKDAAFKLFEEGRFENITVQDILDEAHVGRTTFYKYFRDKYELMAAYYNARMAETINAATGLSFRDYVKATYRQLDNSRQYLNNVKDTMGQNSFWDVVSEYTYNYHKNRLLENKRVTDLTERDELHLEFLVAGVIALVKNYLSKPIGEADIESYVAVVCSMFPEELQ